jgi:glycosyltransferase involved in cell wall biosynthesis
MWLRIAAKRGSAMRIETLAAESPADPIACVRDRVEAISAEGTRGCLYIFVRQPPDRALTQALRWIVADRRLEPAIVAEGTASRAHLDLLQETGVRLLYVTLYGGTASAHDARSGEPGSWRRAVAVLTMARRILERVRVGAHFVLSPDSADELPKVLQLMGRLDGAELLLWDAGCSGMDVDGLEPPAALRALDFAVTAASKLHVPIRPVGFERTRAAVVSTNRHPCVLSGAVAQLLQEGIPLPSTRAGVLATEGGSAAIAEPAPTGRAVRQLAFELAGSGIPVLDLPACLGGPPPELASARPDGAKTPVCRQCPIDSRCAGVPGSLMAIPGMGKELRPPGHWLAVPEHARVLLLCGPVSDGVYGATFFSLGRALARLGAQVDVVTPWAIHAAFAPSLSERQPLGRPDGPSEVEKFIADGPVAGYDLIVTPDPKVTHPLVVNRRLRSGTRLAVTDFHMLGGMDMWVRDLCAPGQRPEEGGWWPSDDIMLYSAFPGYAQLYTRYGVPMRQVAWQPYALDPVYFPVERPVTEGTSIISAGHHRRDLDTLLAAAARLAPHVHPIDLIAPGEPPQVPRQVRFHGTVSVSVFCSEVGRSRFMVVPLLNDPHNAAGITAIVTAIMCGRPVVVTATAAARDYVTDGVNGLLVPPGDPQAMAEAIERLDTDPALLSALAAGARDAAGKLTTEAWARALLHGSGTYDAEHWVWTKWRCRVARAYT